MNKSYARPTWTALVCGAAVAAMLSGCSSGGSSKAPARSQPTTTAASTAPSPSASAPAWASAFGSGVTITAPERTAPGHASPGAAVAGMLSAFQSGQLSKACPYLTPSHQPNCEKSASQASPSETPSAKDAALGYIAIDGSQALVGTTGAFCASGQTGCFTNSDPAALFSAGRSFSALWNASSTPTAYSLTPCTKIDGKWYVSD